MKRGGGVHTVPADSPHPGGQMQEATSRTAEPVGESRGARALLGVSFRPVWPGNSDLSRVGRGGRRAGRGCW